MTVPSQASPGAEEDAWWRIDDDAAVAAVRRAAAAMATRSGFTPGRVGEVGIVVSELATNLLRHARGGELVLRAGGSGPDASLRVLAIDSGPGSRNIDALISDGASTRGTLGIGLGACIRLSTAFDIYSVPALGTVVEAVLGAEPSTDADGDGDGNRDIDAGIAHLTRPLSPETVCGDAAVHRSYAGGVVAMVADGLGHGPLAALASRRAAEVLLASDSVSPATLLARMHSALAGTRGAAIAIVRHDSAAGTLTHAGVGNVTVRLVGEGGLRALPSQPGIVGHRIPRLREQAQPVDQVTAVVLHSDGLTQRWSLDDAPGVLRHRPAVVGAALVRAAATRRDDASVLVLRIAS